jgi:hypothetical protein
VGLVLDKSKGLVLGPELVTNGTFDTDATGWVAGGTASQSVVAGKLRVTAGATAGGYSKTTIPVQPNKTYLLTANMVPGTGGRARIGVWYGGGYQHEQNLDSQAHPSGIIHVLFSSVGATSLDVMVWPSTYSAHGASGDYADFDNISVKELPGNHATQATSASRPILRQDANGKYYLFFDGVDDSLSTGSIDFTSTDKMTVFAGVRKLSDAAAGMLAEMSVVANSNSGAFAVAAPGWSPVASQYGSLIKGAGENPPYANSPAAFTAPITNVLAMQYNLGGAANTDVIKMRVNASDRALTFFNGPVGGGNFGNYPLYIGRRAGTSLPFNGHLYSLIIRGAASTDAQIASAESYVNSKTGAY